MICIEGELYSVDARFEQQMRDAVQSAYAPAADQRLPYSYTGAYSQSPDDRPSLIVSLPLSGTGVAVLQISGAIVRGDSYWSPSWGVIAQDLKFLEDRANVTGVVLLLDTPGGSAMGCEEVCDIVSQYAKPIVAYVTGYGCSAGYRLACHCDQIFATKSAQLGSIGTAMTLIDESKYYEEEGRKVVSISTGPLKTIGQRGLPITDEQRMFLAEVVQREQDGFLRSLTARGLTAEQQSAVLTGGYWPAEQAQQMGLIDGIKSVDEVITDTVSMVKSLEPKSTESERDTPDGKEKGKDDMTNVTGQPAVDTGKEKTSVSIARIKQLCPGAVADFVLQQAEIADNDEVKVLQAFTAYQSAEIDKLKTSQTLASVVGTAPVGSTQLSQTPAEGSSGTGLTGDVLQQFEGLIDEAVKTGVTRQQALMSVTQEHPELHQQYVAAFRKITPEQVAARRQRAGVQIAVTAK